MTLFWRRWDSHTSVQHSTALESFRQTSYLIFNYQVQVLDQWKKVGHWWRWIRLHLRKPGRKHRLYPGPVMYVNFLQVDQRWDAHTSTLAWKAMAQVCGGCWWGAQSAASEKEGPEKTCSLCLHSRSPFRAYSWRQGWFLLLACGSLMSNLVWVLETRWPETSVPTLLLVTILETWPPWCCLLIASSLPVLCSMDGFSGNSGSSSPCMI